MRKTAFYFFIIIFNLLTFCGYSQVNCVTDPPLPPVLNYVSVDPASGFTTLNWSLSPSPDIAAYILYTYENGDGLPVDTLWDPGLTSYTLPTTGTKYFSTSYVIAAMRLPRCTSILSNVLTTIFFTAEIDTCSNKIILNWNSYPSLPKSVTSYSVMSSTDNLNFSELDNVSSDTTSYSFEDFETNLEYCFYVVANLEDGSGSMSNKVCLQTKTQKPPEWINADYATVEDDGSISLSFTIDPSTNITTYSLGKKTGSLGDYQEISRFASVTGSLNFSDNNADINSVNYYRLSAINSCNLPVTISNICSNIVLSLSDNGDDMVFNWNPYREWLGSVATYRLFVDTGNGFSDRSLIQPPDTSTVLNYKDIMYEVTGDEVCFYIDAIESGNPHAVTGESHSSVSCTHPVEIVTVPNIFTPDNDLLNDRFKPVMSFIPADYHLVISDRKGYSVFDSKDYMNAWDGTRRGVPLPQDVYLWFLKVTSPSGKVITKTGTVTIMRKR